MRILSLDISTKTGYALIDEKGYNPQDDNEADAINLALYSFEKVNK